MTSWNGNIFRVTGHLYAWNLPVIGEFPAQRPVMQSFDVFFDLRPNKRLSKQWWGWWFETPSCPSKRHCNGNIISVLILERWEASQITIWCYLNVVSSPLLTFITGSQSSGINYRLAPQASSPWLITVLIMKYTWLSNEAHILCLNKMGCFIS